MTVAELIKTLQDLPQDSIICLSVYRHSYDSVNHSGSHGDMVVRHWHNGYHPSEHNRVIIASSDWDLGE